MLRKLAQHAPVVTLFMAGTIAGFMAGMAIGAQAPSAGPAGSDIAALLGALAGAAITVMGAVWVADHRADKERDRLRLILVEGLRRLQHQAALPFEQVTTSAAGRLRARAVFNRWQYLAAFSPYRELDAFDQIHAMAEVDACCRSLAAHLDEPRDQVNGGGTSAIVAALAVRRGAGSPSVVQEACEEIVRRCDDALKALS
ncbi:hypothetical protein CSC76_06645 [Pseudoxanthomonas mexicana]|uniref:hypothetical protein n=1 Tax=Pseudoxanthomonas mexicana TaxID=128785 RepID=UPI0013894BE9|nr:hypothetical protein [Pseudoxanthomonas mexicana]KAF1728140.1 hypothetical protein CSC76_06645 [Pseudoxanthomonas mexicana]